MHRRETTETEREKKRKGKEREGTIDTAKGLMFTVYIVMWKKSETDRIEGWKGRGMQKWSWTKEGTSLALLGRLFIYLLLK